jgi:hypothetical protein
MKSRQMIAVAVAVALGLPGVYLVCLAAGVDPIARLERTIVPKTPAAEPVGEAPFLPDPPGSVKVGKFSFDEKNAVSFRCYESSLPPRQLADALEALMRENGWETNESWKKNVGASTKGAISLAFRQDGWQCEAHITESSENPGGSAVTMLLLPVPR